MFLLFQNCNIDSVLNDDNISDVRTNEACNQIPARPSNICSVSNGRSSDEGSSTVTLQNSTISDQNSSDTETISCNQLLQNRVNENNCVEDFSSILSSNVRIIISNIFIYYLAILKMYIYCD